MNQRVGVIRLSLAILICSIADNALGATNLAPLSETNLTAQAWQTSRTNLTTRTEDDAGLQQRLLEIHSNALARAHSVVELNASVMEHGKTIANATNVLAALRETKAVDAGLTNSLQGLDSTQLEGQLTQAEADLAAARKALATLEAEAQQRLARRAEAPKEAAEAKTRLDEIEVALSAKSDPGEPPQVARATRLYLLTRQSYRQQQIKALDLELKAYNATAEVLTLQTELAKARATALARHVDNVRSRLDEVRQAESQAAALAARQAEAEARNPVLQQLAATNTSYASEVVKINGDIGRANDALGEMEKDVAALELDYKNLATRVTANEAAGVKITDSIGVLLRRHRVDLARRSATTNGIRSRIARITDVQLEEIDLKDRRSEFDLESAFAEAMSRLGQPPDGDAGDEVRRILETRVRLLNDLISAHSKLAEALSSVNALEIRLRKSTAAFRQFVEERVLWIRSANPLAFSSSGARSIADEVRTYAILLNWKTWHKVLEALLAGITAAPFTSTLWILLLVGAFGAQPATRRQLDEQGGLARLPSQVSLLPTLKSLGLTLILAIPGPLLLHAIGATLTQGYAPSGIATQLAAALKVSSLLYLTLGFYRHFMRSKGLAVCHLSWAADSAARIRRHLVWFIGVSIPAAAFIVFAEARVGEGGEDRLTFIGLMLVLSYFLRLLFNPTNGLAFNPANSRTGATTRRLRHIAGVVMPIGLAITSALGYHLTAIEFAWRLTNSIWLVLGITLISAIIVRWFYLERRRIALEKLRIKREAAEGADKTRPAEVEIPDVSVTEVKEQTQSLLRTLVLISMIGGLWAIWSGVLPALNILDRKALWYVEETISPPTEKSEFPGLPGIPTAKPDADADTDVRTAPASALLKTVQRPITLVDLMLALFVMVVTGIAARNLPGFLEISILKHLKLETGGGYAITTIVQYVVTIVGLVISCAIIGLTWEKVQWLAAAVTLGIGFGLQEIFANFVAGIILLFERPVRVGDIINVDNTTGVVTRIRIRATTIRNWDRQELIIPNKDLITGRLTNWTLSDTMNRVVVTVGVAYGSDTRQVRELLRGILRDHPDILPDPASSVVFDQFGDSSLNFTVRAFLNTLDNRLETIHTLHELIHDRFNEAGIEISFPQRDLHIRSLPSGFGETGKGA